MEKTQVEHVTCVQCMSTYISYAAVWMYAFLGMHAFHSMFASQISVFLAQDLVRTERPNLRYYKHLPEFAEVLFTGVEHLKPHLVTWGTHGGSRLLEFVLRL